MDNLTEDEPKKIGGKYHPASALQGQVTVAQADKASRSQVGKDGRYHGKYRQITMRLRPEVAREMEDWATRLNVSKAALQRYVIWRGLQALEDGERPETTRVTEMKEY
ncbi:MAG: hypothetical protein GY803_11585 [Chloroflexi bacterium]|nr:hypothetical protein [Chloroflexota bacterium]